MKSIADAFARAAELGIERADAMVLMSARTGFTRATLLAFGERELALHAAQLEDDFAQRAQGVPVAYLIGYQEFFGLRLQVSPAVLVPRADTEIVVEAILAAELPQHAQVLDLGTGSGAIALAVKSQRPDWHVTAVDQSSAALEIAQQNAKTYQLAIEWRLGDWFAPLENGQRFDLIASNPPYLDARDAHLHDLRFEPLQALTAANSGLADLQHIVNCAPGFLRAKAWLMLEHGYQQSQQVRTLLLTRGFEKVRSIKDLAGIERVSMGLWPGTQHPPTRE